MKENLQSIAQKPRFPDRRGKARNIEDLSSECKKWKRFGACDLDRDFNISSRNPSAIDTVTSNDMFDFMLKACSDTCGWANGKIDITGSVNKSQSHGLCQVVMMSTPAVLSGPGWACVFTRATSWPTPAGRAAASAGSCLLLIR